MCSVGQLQAKTMCGLGFLGFWILGRKEERGVLEVVM